MISLLCGATVLSTNAPPFSVPLIPLASASSAIAAAQPHSPFVSSLLPKGAVAVDLATLGPQQPGTDIASTKPSEGPLPDATESFSITSDHMEAELSGQVVRATGNVSARWKDYQLNAQELVFDVANRRGRARRGVDLEVRGYQLRSDDLDFDLQTGQIRTGPWTGFVPRRGKVSGDYLFLSGHYALAKATVFSPCLGGDPGYFFTGDRVEWYPHAGKQHFEVAGVALHVSDTQLVRLPSAAATLDSRRLEQQDRRGGRPMSANAGYNAYDGVFAAGAGAYQLSDNISGAIPIRISQGRGIQVGTANTLNVGPAILSGDASYQSPFKGGTFGPRANISAAVAVPNGPTMSLQAGYRSDVGAQAVDRLGDLSLAFPPLRLGPLTAMPTARLGYFWELEGSEHRAALYSWGATILPPSLRVGTFWESAPFANGAAVGYWQRDPSTSWQWEPRDRWSGAIGVHNLQHWSRWLTTDLGAESDKVKGSSPFFFDPVPDGERFFGALTATLNRHWSTGLQATYFRAPDTHISRFNDLSANVSYRASCLSWTLSSTMTLNPFNLAVGFTYSFGP